jgi:predicted transcriptional regulator
MRPKLLKKERARVLRHRGKSLKSIAKMLGVAKSSVSLWCSDICLTENQLNRLKSRLNAPKLGALANKVKRQKEIQEIRHKSKAEFTRLNIKDNDRLRDIGTILYWAEGAKTGRQIDFTNSDPQIIKLAMLWLRKIHKVPREKFRAAIYFHAGQDERMIKKYWSDITGIPLCQFHKSIFKKEGTGHRKNILYNGTCKIRVCDSNLLNKVLAWIEQFYI